MAKSPAKHRPSLTSLKTSPEERALLELAERYFQRPGRHVADSARKALIVDALIERHGITPKKRAILAIASVREFAAVERAYQKLLKSRRPRFISDRHPELKAALVRLRPAK